MKRSLIYLISYIFFAKSFTKIRNFLDCRITIFRFFYRKKYRVGFRKDGSQRGEAYLIANVALSS